MTSANVSSDPEQDPFILRPYQAEMVEESLRSNIICVMDTGSGKTHIAIERSRIELEECLPSKKIWFLAPTVALLEQQYQIFQRNLPSYGCLLLSGNDNVDHWTEKSTWDSILHNIRLVMATHQVLLDALTHAFVKIEDIALLIFDEAHHCTGKHPARRIMSDFYMHQAELDQAQLPRVLGLSASPVMKAKATSQELQQIEQNLCATAKTPKRHRTELMRYVHMPAIIECPYQNTPYSATYVTSASHLRSAFNCYDFKQDPYIISLLKQKRAGQDVSAQLSKILISGKTYCRDQLKWFASKAEAMLEELGLSPMEWYVQQCINHFEEMAMNSSYQPLDFSADEKQHLLGILQQLPLQNKAKKESIHWESISEKVALLLDVLVNIAADTPEFTGIVFIEQRVWVAALSGILSTHPRTKSLFRLGTFVGTSQSSKRKTEIASFAEPKNQQTTLEDFRAGRINLILATSVLEEGIDVSSCHLVICFERPKNLKSFIQRRGRARMQKSKYLIFTPQSEHIRSSASWRALEEQMKDAYLDDLRQAQIAAAAELEEEDGQRFYRVPSTGALLTLDNASQHLHHFCALLSSGPYTETRPQFNFTQQASGLMSARVFLPISVDPAIRTANSKEFWRTERMARKDAAFEAYRALHEAGLVNDHLLPAGEEFDEDLANSQILLERPSIIMASPTFDPWPKIARQQEHNPKTHYRTLLEVQLPGFEITTFMLLLTPMKLSVTPSVVLHWNASQNITVGIKQLSDIDIPAKHIASLKLFTYKLLYSIYQSRMQAERSDFLYSILPCDASGNIKYAEIEGQDLGLSTAISLINNGKADAENWGLMCVDGLAGRYVAHTINHSSHADVPTINAVSLPKRRDFLHPMQNTENARDAYTRLEEFDAKDCTVEDIPATHSLFALLFPSILYRLEVGLLANELTKTILQPVGFSEMHFPIIIRAITASQTGESDNYQRLEFLGDCILKFITSVHLLAVKPLWPEGHLTAKKGSLVSNANLARATIQTGLDKFILTKRFTGAKWAPQYAGDLLTMSTDTETIGRSSKLLADVVESIIGASYVVGGFDMAFRCVQTLLPLEPWTPISIANSMMMNAAQAQATVTSFGVLENIIGYSFSNKTLLLDALTHVSYTGPHGRCSYERLEFLGDAVLDYIVSRRLNAHEPALSLQQSHGIRTAMVNASFLAFRMFETTANEETINKATFEPELQARALWQFLRSSSLGVNTSREAALEQHIHARVQIAEALDSDATFPWHLLALTDAPKFLSDIVESVLGAIYIDCRGDVDTCENFICRLGIIECLQRILDNGVDCLHPKERLGHLAVERQVQYLRVAADEPENESPLQLYRCQVSVGGVNVGGVVEGLKRLNAETIAAWKACAILSQGDDVSMGECDDSVHADKDG